MLTKEQAMTARYRQEFFHKKERDSKGNPVKIRVNGMCRTWKRDPRRFELPCKHGFNGFYTVTDSNCAEWCMTAEEAMGNPPEEPVRAAMRAVRQVNS